MNGNMVIQAEVSSESVTGASHVAETVESGGDLVSSNIVAECCVGA